VSQNALNAEHRYWVAAGRVIASILLVVHPKQVPAPRGHVEDVHFDRL